MKKRYKDKTIKCFNGTISILLCILVAPFLTIAGYLIEMSRYQQVKQTVDELLNSSILSELANYDKYIEERFGLFAIAQDNDIETNLKINFEENSKKILGNAITSNTLTAKGALALSDPKVLEQQIMDFSEITIMADVAYKDFNIDEIIKAIKKDTGLDKFEKAAGNAADLATAVAKLVEESDKLGTKIAEVIIEVDTAITQENALVASIEAFYTKAHGLETDLSLLYDTDSSNDAGILNLIISECETEAKKMLNDIKSLTATLNNVVTKIAEIPGIISSIKDAYDDAIEAFDKMSEEEKTADVLGVVLEELEDALSDAAIQGLLSSVATLTSGIGIFTGLMVDIFSATAVNLSNADAKNAIKDIIVGIHPNFAGSDDLTNLQDVIKENFNFNEFDIGGFKNTITGFNGDIDVATQGAENTYTQATQGLIAILEQLLSALRGLFELDVFYNPDFDAYLSDEIASQLIVEGDNPYQTFLEAVEGTFTAVREFIDSFANLNFFKALKAVAEFFKSLATLMESVIQWIDMVASTIAEKFNLILSGDFEDMYKLLLLAGYMTHNLPDRTCGGDAKVDNDTLRLYTELKGKAATGFSYKNIPVAFQDENRVPIQGVNGIQSLISLIDDLSSGGGDEEMFRGAELEYILAGTQSEAMNQIIVFFNIYFMRMIMDLPAIFADPAVNSMAATANIASWAVYILVMIGEPLIDTILLVNGGNSYAVKGACYLTPTGVWSLINDAIPVLVGNSSVKDALKEKTKEMNPVEPDATTKKAAASKNKFPMDYRAHILLSLILSTQKEPILNRFSNLIFLESNAYYKKKGVTIDYEIDKMYTCIDVTANVTFNPLMDAFSQNGGGVFRVSRRKIRGY